MTKTCQCCAVTITTLCLFLLLLPALSVSAQEDVRGEQARSLQQLQQSNAELERQVRRLQHQVAAQREELNQPGITEVVGGIGYIVGVFGIVGWYAARKKTAKGTV